MTKNQRGKAILEIISENRIANQKELLECLQKRGYAVTQATISRDITELGISKVNKKGESFYEKPIDPKLIKLKTLFHQSVIKIDSTGNLIVLKTISGAANSACSLVDALEEENIVGTIAGDDTVFIAIRNEKALPKIIKLLEQFRE